MLKRVLSKTAATILAVILLVAVGVTATTFLVSDVEGLGSGSANVVWWHLNQENPALVDKVEISLGPGALGAHAEIHVALKNEAGAVVSTGSATLTAGLDTLGAEVSDVPASDIEAIPITLLK